MKALIIALATLMFASLAFATEQVRGSVEVNEPGRLYLKNGESGQAVVSLNWLRGQADLSMIMTCKIERDVFVYAISQTTTKRFERFEVGLFRNQVCLVSVYLLSGPSTKYWLTVESSGSTADQPRYLNQDLGTEADRAFYRSQR